MREFTLVGLFQLRAGICPLRMRLLHPEKFFVRVVLLRGKAKPGDGPTRFTAECGVGRLFYGI